MQVYIFHFTGFLWTFNQIGYFLQQKKQISVEINDYRKQFQQPKDRIEADLNDKLMVMRMDDNDPRLSISGGQMLVNLLVKKWII